MIVIMGFDELLKKHRDLPKLGWLYVGSSFNLESRNNIINGEYFLAETEGEEMDFEEKYGTFLEAPIFTAIIEKEIVNNPNSTKDDFLNATVQYLKNDGFYN
ncbi:hypothetical protein BSU01_20585 [Erwinia billingiae]|uniref:hypothetical protein n=1 Tax=Erwinia billingiae TaxID=182337 RepID=UPI0019CFD5ED|nr:hypothetical protein [Erwinia billingiae]MBN7124091.1 hypothetical protein [Erwinia billingiae]